MFKYRVNSEYTVKVFVLLVARWSVDKKKMKLMNMLLNYIINSRILKFAL